jgi:hypothetical protein
LRRFHQAIFINVFTPEQEKIAAIYVLASVFIVALDCRVASLLAMTIFELPDLRCFYCSHFPPIQAFSSEDTNQYNHAAHNKISRLIAPAGILSCRPVRKGFLTAH